MAGMGPQPRAPYNYVGVIGWSVGVTSWLDSPTSRVGRYWRVIEHGSAATQWPWQGQLVAGLWGPRAEPRGGLHGSARSAFQPGLGNEKFAPYFRTIGQDMTGPARRALIVLMGGNAKKPNLQAFEGVATYFYRKKKGKPAEKVMARTPGQMRKAQRGLWFWLMTRADARQIPFVTGVIQRPVVAADYYGKALSTFPMRDMQIQALRNALGSALGNSSRMSEQLRAAQRQFAEDSSYFDTPARVPRQGYLPKAKLKGDAYAAGLPGHVGNIVVKAASAEVQSLITTQNAKFVNGVWQQALREANEYVAMAFQRHVAELMQAGTRPPTKALREATLAPENRYPRDKGVSA